MTEINVKRCNPANYGGNRGMGVVDWIVIHYTSNRGDTAKNNADYFAREKVSASAHYFVDETEVWESVPLSHNAWHCGGGRQGDTGGALLGKVKNSNSIGVEICMLDKSGGVRAGSIRKAAELVRWLMGKYDISIDHVVRHWDVTGKECPAPMIGESALWREFLDMLKEDESMKTYQYVRDMPEWAQASVTKAIQKGIVAMDQSGAVSVLECNLQPLVWMDRAGMLDK